MSPHRLSCALLALFVLGFDVRAQTPSEPYCGATEPGVPFPLHQELQYGRRKVEGGSNALTFSWDGRLIMYADSGLYDENNVALWQGHTPTGADPEGFVFAAFDPKNIKVVNGRTNFAPPGLPPAIGAPFPRFAQVDDATPPDMTGNNSYPKYDPSGSTNIPHYPYIAGTTGELGLHSYDFLSNNMYPAPVSELPSGANDQNPYPSDANGSPLEFGAYRTYRAYVTFQDLPRFWDPSTSLWRGYTIPVSGMPHFEYLGQYPPGTYPNGRSVDATHNSVGMKRNGIAQLEITTDPTANTVLRVAILRKWKPFILSTPGWTTQPGMNSVVGLGLPSTSTMYTDNFEPVLTHDGHLMVGKGSPYLVNNIGQTSRVMFYYNQTAFSDTGWVGPYELTKLNSMNSIVLGTGTDARSIAERYPISRHPFKDYAGNVLSSTDPFEGGYTWLDPDGRFLIYSVYRSGVGDGMGTYPLNTDPEPECWLASDGGSGSNRGHTSIVGSVTGWQMWRIDHEAENANRHMFTAWDQQSRTTHLRVASLGFSPGFWNVLKGAEGLPLRDDGHLKLQLINSNRLLYYELDLSPYQERDYGFYLPMTEMLTMLPSLDPINDPDGVRREVDLDHTPDLSGNGHVGILDHGHAGQLPCEYFNLPSFTNSAPGLYQSASTTGAIALGWTAADTVPGLNGGYWAKLADWKDGHDANMDANHTIDTQPFAGRGNQRDMDSDACWGRVGEAMFFKDATWVRVANNGAPELNPGVLGNARGFTASFWINPRQTRNADTAVFQHNFTITLKQNGAISATLAGTTITSGTTLAAVDSWTHVAFTWTDTSTASSSAMALFLNGNQVGRGTIASDNLTASSADITVGCLATCASDPSRAVFLLDEVALKNSALIGQDVVDLALGPIPIVGWTTQNLNLAPAPPPFVDATDARVPMTDHYDPTVANLGADLFRDVQLSSSKTKSCALCHDPANAFVDGLETPTGNIRNTPTIYNQRFQIQQFWDRRALDLEDQVAFPLASTSEQNFPLDSVVIYVNADPSYPALFNAAFGSSTATTTMVRQAIATYERAVMVGNAPADRYSATNLSALTPNAKIGRGLFFGKARCSGCHNGPNFTDGRLWTTGDFRSDGTDDGAFNATAGASTAGRARFKGAFKTPTLRELSRTGPYFHDGRGGTLDDVIDFYQAGGVRQDDAAHAGYALLDSGHDIVAEEINHKLGLTDNERADLKEYLLSLTSDSSSTVDDGPTGNNHVPTVTGITTAYNTTTGTVTVAADVKDLADLLDIDPNMSWTLDLELPLGGTHYHWADGTWSAISGGYQSTIAKPGPSSGQYRIRAADHHGLWTGWTTVSY